MPADPQVLNGKIQHGSPLFRLQDVFQDAERGVLVGDVKDAIAACDSAAEEFPKAAVTRLMGLVAGKLKGETILVPPQDIAELTNFLKASGTAVAK